MITQTEDVQEGELFNVVQFFEDDSYEYAKRGINLEELAPALFHYTDNVATRLGLVKRVIATDMLDRTVFEWKAGQGVVFPPANGD